MRENRVVNYLQQREDNEYTGTAVLVMRKVTNTMKVNNMECGNQAQNLLMMHQLEQRGVIKTYLQEMPDCKQPGNAEIDPLQFLRRYRLMLKLTKKGKRMETTPPKRSEK